MDITGGHADRHDLGAALDAKAPIGIGNGDEGYRDKSGFPHSLTVHEVRVLPTNGSLVLPPRTGPPWPWCKRSRT